MAAAPFEGVDSAADEQSPLAAVQSRKVLFIETDKTNITKI